MKQTLLAVVALGACGDAIVPGSYRGEPLYSIEGYVELELSPEDLLGPADEDPSDLRVALLWSQTKGSSFDLDGASEQEVVTTGSFPARYEVTIYEPPEDAVLRGVSDGSGEMALGALIAYVDTDGDGHFDRGSETLVGGAEDRLFLYTPDGITSAAFGELGPGFHRLLPTEKCEATTAATLRFDADLSSSITLQVDGLFPKAAFVDVDCDPETVDWNGPCPTPDVLGEICESDEHRDPADEATCEFCGDRRCPDEIEGDGYLCNEWAVKEGLEEMSVCDVDFEWHDCRGDQGPPPPPTNGFCDLRRFCDRVFEACRDDGSGWDYCEEQRHDCTTSHH